MVESVVHEHPDAEDEEGRHQHHVVSGDHRTGNGDDDGHELRQERQHDENDPDAHADDAGRHPGEIGDRDAGRLGRVRNGARQAGQQVAEAVGGERTLDRLEVDGARPAP